ncbi:hypothetical protein EVAR_16148_1 [Eumeta japonica]|uniref:Uncharacterized protein n=1 Tax=Eumeta variegata TaxID=151549 RepID=A0A4C1WDD0_EUMVA|nr:hypothetical protein EVAR_16148_1 [Eumeta japonica]
MRTGKRNHTAGQTAQTLTKEQERRHINKSADLKFLLENSAGQSPLSLIGCAREVSVASYETGRQAQSPRRDGAFGQSDHAEMWCTRLCLATLCVAFVTCAALPAPDWNWNMSEDMLINLNESEDDPKLRENRNIFGFGGCPKGMIRCPFIGCLENTKNNQLLGDSPTLTRGSLTFIVLPTLHLPVVLPDHSERLWPNTTHAYEKRYIRITTALKFSIVKLFARSEERGARPSAVTDVADA